MSMQTIESGGLEVLNGSITVVGGTISGTFVGDGGSIVGTVLSSSYASTSSFVSGAYTSQWALTSSFVTTASYALNSSGQVTSAQTASVAFSVSGSGTGSFTGSFTGSATTASFVSGAYTSQWALTSSFATTSSYALNSAGSVTSAQTASVAFTLSGSATGTLTGSITGALLGTSSWANSASFVSASYVAGWAQKTDSSSFVSASYVAGWAQKTDSSSFVSGAYTSQWALSASAATSITFIPASASYANSASAAGQFFAAGITGSHTGTLTGSATNAVSSSFVSGAYTSQWALSAQSAVGNAGTATALATGRLINGTNFDGTTNIATTSSWSTISSIPAGLVSSSTQFNSLTGPLTGALSGTVTGTLQGLASSASFVSGAYTAQWAKVTDSASFVSGAYAAQWALSASAATSITFIPTSASYATSASAAGQFFVAGITGSHTGTLTGSATTAVTSSFVSGAYTSQWTLLAQSAVGNAGTATALATARLINGVSFDGTTNIATTSSWSTISSIPVGLVSASAQINSGSFTGSFTGSATTAISASFVSGAYTAQWALSSSYATSASWAPGGTFDATISRGYTGSFTGSVTGALQGTSSWANSASTAISASYAPGGSAFDPTISRGYTGSFTGSVTGALQGSSSYAPSAWDDISNIPIGLVSSSTQFKTLTDSFTGSYSGTFVGNGTNLSGVVASAAPAGPNKSVQFNDNGATSGSSNFLFDKSTNKIIVTGTIEINNAITGSAGLLIHNGKLEYDDVTDTLVLSSSAVNPAFAISGGFMDWGMIQPNTPTPPADTLRVWAKKISGRMLPKWMGPSGVDNPFQSALFGNNIILYTPTAGTTVTGGFGTLWAKGGSAGTVSHPPPSVSSNADRTMLDQLKRTRHVNVVTTANQACGIISTAASSSQFWRGNAAGLGGFFFFARFGIGHLPNQPTGSYRLFAGLTPGTAEVVSSDVVPANSVGLWRDAAAGNSLSTLYFVTKDATTISSQSITGARLVTGSVFDVFIYAKPNDSAIYWRVDDVSSSITLADTGTLQNLPVNTVFLGPQVEISNGTASLAVATVGIDVNRIYVESDH